MYDQEVADKRAALVEDHRDELAKFDRPPADPLQTLSRPHSGLELSHMSAGADSLLPCACYAFS
eukprot:516349-Pyramimonas_sp.AAC.1